MKKLMYLSLLAVGLNLASCGVEVKPSDISKSETSKEETSKDPKATPAEKNAANDASAEMTIEDLKTKMEANKDAWIGKEVTVVGLFNSVSTSGETSNLTLSNSDFSKACGVISSKTKIELQAQRTKVRIKGKVTGKGYFGPNIEMTSIEVVK